MVFENPEKALEFSKHPSIGIAKMTRDFIKNRGENYEEYDIFFNLSVIYDETKNNKKPNIVTVRVL